MATENDTKPHDPLVFILGRYEALAQLAAEHLGHSSPTLVLLDDLNADLRAFVDSLDQREMLS